MTRDQQQYQAKKAYERDVRGRIAKAKVLTERAQRQAQSQVTPVAATETKGSASTEALSTESSQGDDAVSGAGVPDARVRRQAPLTQEARDERLRRLEAALLQTPAGPEQTFSLLSGSNKRTINKQIQKIQERLSELTRLESLSETAEEKQAPQQQPQQLAGVGSSGAYVDTYPRCRACRKKGPKDLLSLLKLESTEQSEDWYEAYPI